MFTGLIQSIGTVAGIRPAGRGLRLVLQPERPLSDLQPGESIAVDGICLTAVDCTPGRFCADISPETVHRTTLGRLVTGRRVNLERALRLADRLGGHIVTGHVDGLGRVGAVVRQGDFFELTVGVEAPLARHIVAKGSVAVDGISLTVASCTEAQFKVALIPTTLTATTLADRRPGDEVNIETDIIGKYVEKLLGGTAQRSSDERLRKLLGEGGFLG